MRWGRRPRAALIAARLIAWPPAGAPTMVPIPVTIIDGRQGTVYPNEFITATPGMFCEAIVTM